jgi:branched-chain amino acid transport system substrate-binding protein
VPADHIQAAAQVTFQKDEGCKKTYILNDKEVYGKGLAT